MRYTTRWPRLMASPRVWPLGIMIRSSARTLSITGRLTCVAPSPVSFSSPASSAIVALPLVEDGGHDLVDGALAGVDDHGVIGGTQRRVLAGRVVGVPA